MLGEVQHCLAVCKVGVGCTFSFVRFLFSARHHLQYVYIEGYARLRSDYPLEDGLFHSFSGSVKQQYSTRERQRLRKTNNFYLISYLVNYLVSDLTVIELIMSILEEKLQT